MKLTACYLYTIDTYGYPPSIEEGLKAIDEQRELGFRFVELEGVGKAHIEAVYAERARFKRSLEERGMACANYCPIYRPLVSMDATEREAAYPVFRLGAQTAKFLGCPTVHVATYTPPVEFIGATPYTQMKFKEEYRVRLPNGFSWAQQWDALVESVRRCADIAAEHDLDLLIEPRVGEMVCHTDSLLRLMDHAERENVKANFDFAHLHAQKEILPLAARKLEGRIGGVHIADNDGADNRHLFPGEGTIDFEGVIRELQRQGYAGSIGVDLGSLPDLGRRYAECAQWLRAFARRLEIPLEG